MVLYKCVVCNKDYDYLKTRSNYRGTCSRKCEKVIEKSVGGLDTKEGRARFSHKMHALRDSIPGADPWTQKKWLW